MSEHISKEEFVIRAIQKLRRPPYRGIHSVYSGFNRAFRQEFNEDPVTTTNQMARDGKIALRPVKGGVMLYLPGQAPLSPGEAALNKIVASGEEKISREDFVLRAISRLRKDPYRGIHATYSGFTEAFRKYFQDNPVEATNRMAAEGKIAIRPVRGGVMFYLPADAPSTLNIESVIKTIKED